MPQRPWPRLAGLALLAAAAAGGCETVPATGESRLALVSDERAARAGARRDPYLRASYGGAYRGSAKADALTAYVERLGTRLVDEIPKAERAFTFTLLNSDEVNAAALPGGYVYVTRGVMAFANSEAQLASIIGHEIAHVTARHSAQQMTQRRLAKLGTGLAGVVVTEPGSAGRAAYTQLAAVGRKAYLASYSRDQEAQADRLGLRYLAAAGYHPGASAAMLRQLQRKKELEVRLGERSKGGAASALFRSHPRTPKRVRQARQAAQLQDTGGKRKRRAYFDKIDGMLYGPDPELGVLDGRTLIRRSPSYRLTLPKAWQVRRWGRGLLMAPQKAPALKLFLDDAELSGGPGALQDHVRTTWLDEARAIDHLRETQLAGRPAVTALAALGDGPQPRLVQVAAVALGQDHVLRLRIRRRQMTVELPTVVRGMLNSLDELNAEERAASAPRRIAIVDPAPGTTWKELAGRSAFDERGPARLRALNGVTPDGPVPDRRIKLVVTE